MLGFFRRYQRYFFLLITVVVIISFSFFGTYNTLGSNSWGEQIAFKAIDGREITRSEVDEMAAFLATDNADKLLYGGVWGPNFLNDGVLRHDLLKTGMLQVLAAAYREDLQEDIDRRFAKEKKYSLYSHPQAPFLGVQAIWAYFAPEMNAHLDQLRAAENGLDPAPFSHRVNLYLAESQLPASTVKQILLYQERQYPWLDPDPLLHRADFSLFGYHTFEDWFGTRLTRLVSEFIINVASLAEAQGYRVSKAEALADLLNNARISYQQQKDNSHLGVTSPQEYLSEQLRRLNIDSSGAVKIWRQVLLFRRYFQDAGSTALLDNLVERGFHRFSHENITLDLYRLPQEMKVADREALQNLETYLRALAKSDQKAPLALPDQFLPVAEVAAVYPELVQKKYALEVAQVDQKSLQARLTLRELWNWEVDDENWATLIKHFPDLGMKKTMTRQERFSFFDELDATTRAEIDAFAKKRLVKAHPEWIDQALSHAQPQLLKIGLRVQGGKGPIEGLDQPQKRQIFMAMLDQAVLRQNPSPESPLHAYTADQQTYYRVKVLERADSPELLTFAEAQREGVLNPVRKRMLEKYYLAVRQSEPSLYRNKEGEWQPYEVVKGLVADRFLAETLRALEPIQFSLASEDEREKVRKESIAQLRFYPYFQQVKQQLEKGEGEGEQWVREAPSTSATPSSLPEQWKLERSRVTVDRQHPEEGVSLAEGLALGIDDWSSIQILPEGGLAFFQVKGKEIDPQDEGALAQQVREMQAFLGGEAQRQLSKKIVEELKEKQALSLVYLNRSSD